jgi:glyoxylase-like metal-dependent hydrolase (beta-lactamase superfamily II)
MEVQARYLGRGHTDGDSVVYFPALKVLHTGDLVIDGMPHIDYDNGASAIEWIKAIDKILQIDFDIAIPGHGRLLTKDDIRDNKAAFEKMNRHMIELVEAGKSKAEATANLKLCLKEIGWDHTVSTLRFLDHSLNPYYDEMAAEVQKTKRQ